MDDVSQQLATLTPEQRTWLELQLKRRGLELPGTQTIPRSKDFNALPLSFAQQRLWFIQQLDPQNASYNIPIALRLQGHLKVAVLQKTFHELIKRHENLRTRFITNDQGQLVQVIDPIQVTLPFVDLSQVSQPEIEIQRLATEAAQRPFNLTQPLLRLTLLHLSETDHVLLLTMHHIISDRWSLGVLVRELKILYEAFSKGENSPLPDLPIQYADWAIWQRQYLQGEVLQQQLDYWKQQLDGLPVLEFPIDRPRPAVSTFRGKQYPFVLSRSLTTALKQLSAQEGVTLFVVLLTAFKVLLHKYTHQDDILVGTDIANRNRIETEGLIGLLVNTLVLRTRLAGNPTFRELLQRVREVTLGAYAHQDLPFEKLVEALNPERTLSHMPLYQIGFDFQQAPIPPLEISDVIINPLPIDNGTVKIDLRLNLWESEQELAGRIEYSTDLFDTITITTISENFRTLLENIVTNSENCLAELSFFPETQRQKLLFDWNNTKARYHENGAVHQLFEAQVKQSPDAIALVHEDQHLTYQELNDRANQLAHYLRSIGVQPEVFVGICLKRSIEMVIGLFAILKAGGTYVPLDPTYLQPRLAHILADTQLAIMLTHSSLLTNLPQSPTHAVCLDACWETIAQHPVDNLTCTATADNLAYLIYTSGSTGTPKGVMVSQRSFINHTEAACAHYELKAGDRILQFASINFDATAEEIFPGLVQGSTIILRTEAMLSTSLSFWQSCDRLSLTVLDLPTAFWHHLVTNLANTQTSLPPTLRLIIIGGESVLPERLATWQQQFRHQIRLVNSYGPTETTIVATLCDLSQPDEIQSKRQKTPIGKPIQNIQVYILDTNLHPVPIGVPGELYIGGVGVARGYLRQAALTAERFLPNPYSLEAGARFYKTGDYVRYRADGQIEFLGRLDHQVKIRGFRVELGEIEATLRQHTALQDAIVLARQDEADYQRLVAYVIPDRQSQQMELLPNLRNFLQERLPSYMLPSAFVVLDELPLTPGSKVDRKALPTPGIYQSELSANHVIPQTEKERAIATIWKETLHLEKVGIHDNFFDLGGHSLLLIQLNNQLREKLQIDLSVLDLFRYPTISSLVGYLNQTHQDLSASHQEISRQVESLQRGKDRIKQRFNRSQQKQNRAYQP
jgi:amino acid adenylation domain-containing protein